jgi:hypothetical protein
MRASANLVSGFLVFIATTLLVISCSDSTSIVTDGDLDAEHDQSTDGDSLDGDSVDGDIAVDGDSDPEADSESDTLPDGDGDSDEVEALANCDEHPHGALKCSEDGWYLATCNNGTWEHSNCWQLENGFCVDGECVPNWTDRDGALSHCPNPEHADPHALFEKAAHMDRLMSQLHMHPQHGLVAPVRLRPDFYTDWAAAHQKAEEDLTPEDYLAAEGEATYEDVATWYPGENDGLFSSIYVASQALRYATTGEPEALANLKLSLGGTYRQLRITGTRGVYTREYHTPGVMPCPENPCSYYPDINRDIKDKDDNRWVKVIDGCVHHFGGPNASYVSDSECTGEWVAEDICGLEEFNDYCWLDNVSQDEYSGHMMAAALAGYLVDDPDIQSIVKDIFSQVGQTLIDDSLAIYDHDGLLTEHSRFWAYSGADYPGFAANFALSFLRGAATITGESTFIDYYYKCLLKTEGELDCIDQPGESPKRPYVEFMENAMFLYVGKDGCVSNWNNFSMAFMAILPLVWLEDDPAFRIRYQEVLENHMIREDNNFRDVIRQKNAMYNFIYAAMRDNRQGLDVQAIEDAVCQLKQFPYSKASAEIHNSQEDRPPNPECISRNGGNLPDTPLEIYQRCPQTNVFWSSPYGWDNCSYDPFMIHPGSDYLYVYWLGRYFGFIRAED